MFLKYKLSLLLCKTFNGEIPENEWLLLNFDQIIIGRQSGFIAIKTYNYHFGLHINNRFHVINGSISLDWLNLPVNSFKLVCKRMFLNFTE